MNNSGASNHSFKAFFLFCFFLTIVIIHHLTYKLSIFLYLHKDELKYEMFILIKKETKCLHEKKGDFMYELTFFFSLGKLVSFNMPLTAFVINWK